MPVVRPDTVYTPDAFVVLDPAVRPALVKMLTVTPDTGTPITALVTVPVMLPPGTSAKLMPDVALGAFTDTAVPLVTVQLAATHVSALNS